jgi:G3E family GTPase
MLEPAPLEILILTGPLGAGKTTVANRLLKREAEAGRKVAVLINEFGGVSVDDVLISTQFGAGGLELAGITNLLNGCACCSLRSEVVETLAAWCALPPEVRPDRVLMETTGLADPTDLVDLELEPLLRGRIRLAGCLTVISCLTPLHHLQQRLLLHHQAALASLVYLSKADLDPSLAMAWESQLRAAFPGIALAHSRMGEAAPGSPDPWEGDLQPRPATSTGGSSFARARSFTLAWDHPLDPAGLEALFLGPVNPGELLRAKGIAAFAGWPPRPDGSDRWAFQVADGRVEITPLPLAADGTPLETMAVLIGTDLDFKAWGKALRDLEQPPPGARRKAVLPSPNPGRS